MLIQEQDSCCSTCVTCQLLPAVLNVKYEEYDSAAAAAAAACGSVGGSAGDSAGRERRPGCEQGHCTKLRRVFAVCPTPLPELGGLLPRTWGSAAAAPPEEKRVLRTHMC